MGDMIKLGVSLLTDNLKGIAYSILALIVLTGVYKVNAINKEVLFLKKENLILSKNIETLENELQYCGEQKRRNNHISDYSEQVTKEVNEEITEKENDEDEYYEILSTDSNGSDITITTDRL